MLFGHVLLPMDDPSSVYLLIVCFFCLVLFSCLLSAPNNYWRFECLLVFFVWHSIYICILYLASFNISCNLSNFFSNAIYTHILFPLSINKSGIHANLIKKMDKTGALEIKMNLYLFGMYLVVINFFFFFFANLIKSGTKMGKLQFEKGNNMFIQMELLCFIL